MLQIIYVISKEDKLLPPYPPHLKNVTTLPCKVQKFFIFFIFNAYRVPIRDMGCAEFQQSVVDDAVDQWQKILEACIRAESRHFEHFL